MSNSERDSVSISREAAEYAAECMEAEEIRIRGIAKGLLDGDIPESLKARFGYQDEILNALQQQEQSE